MRSGEEWVYRVETLEGFHEIYAHAIWSVVVGWWEKAYQVEIEGPISGLH